MRGRTRNRDENPTSPVIERGSVAGVHVAAVADASVPAAQAVVGRARSFSPRKTHNSLGDKAPCAQDGECLTAFFLSSNGQSWRNDRGWPDAATYHLRGLVAGGQVEDTEQGRGRRSGEGAGTSPSTQHAGVPPSAVPRKFPPLPQISKPTTPTTELSPTGSQLPDTCNNPFMPTTVVAGSLNPFAGGTDLSVPGAASSLWELYPHSSKISSSKRSEPNSPRSHLRPAAQRAPCTPPVNLSKNLISHSDGRRRKGSAEVGAAWYGVSVGDGNRVTELKLSDNGLVGTMPARLGSLDMLRYFHVHRNFLTGAGFYNRLPDGV